MATMLGDEHGFIEFYWKFPNFALGYDFRLIKNEVDIIELCRNVFTNRYIFVYISTSGVVVEENITGLVNEIDDNAVFDNEQHDNVVPENAVNDIKVNENENRPTSLEIVVYKGILKVGMI